MGRPATWRRLAMAIAVAALAGTTVAAAPADRLERFRTLSRTILGGAQIGDEPDAAFGEIYALLDEEIVESLTSGGVFASLAFLQDRLDTFSEVWGATVVRLSRAGPLLVGAFQLADAPLGASVRVYGPMRSGPGRSEPALLGTMSREGRPIVQPLPAVDGSAQFLAAWEGGASGHGTRSLRIEQARQHGESVRVVWSTSDVYPEGLYARRWSMRAGELRVHYELRYPGWAPGCDGQSEQEDVYRLGPRGTFARVSARPLNPWHREFRAVVARLVDAASAGNHAVVTTLVPDPSLRNRLPRTLATEPACDAREPGPPERVSVAARAEDRPWQLVFQRGPAGWRLSRASPVLQ